MSSPYDPHRRTTRPARLAQWHQNGEALLTFENLRSWMNVAGLVLFTPRPQQLPSPAPSFVEAVLGTTNAEPTLADTEQARSLLTRMIAEGIAVPLNLLGTPAQNSGDVPDFIVSATRLPLHLHAARRQGLEAAAGDERRLQGVSSRGRHLRLLADRQAADRCRPTISRLGWARRSPRPPCFAH